MLSVLLCTHNPRPDHLAAALAGLAAQTLPPAAWELLLIDNASAPPLRRHLAATHSLPARARIIHEEWLGLAYARARGILESRGELLVFVDDDNVLAPDYLARAWELFRSRPRLGAAGGRIVPRYARPVPAWCEPFTSLLALRDLGRVPRFAAWDGPGRDYPPFAPVGAGMVLRRAIGVSYLRAMGDGPFICDRRGEELGAAGDGELVLTALRGGWEIGYAPELGLTHLIPAERLTLRHLARLNRAGSESWVRLLRKYGLSPWAPIPRWTVGLRQARAFLVQQAWRDRASYFRWAGACGIFAGRA